MVVQLMLGRHPAGTEDNHLPAKVIISYKDDIPPSGFSHFILTDRKSLRPHPRALLSHWLKCSRFSELNGKYVINYEL